MHSHRTEQHYEWLRSGKPVPMWNSCYRWSWWLSLLIHSSTCTWSRVGTYGWKSRCYVASRRRSNHLLKNARFGGSLPLGMVGRVLVDGKVNKVCFSCLVFMQRFNWENCVERNMVYSLNAQLRIFNHNMACITVTALWALSRPSMVRRRQREKGVTNERPGLGTG